MKIFLATGASGGHLFPAIDVAAELRARGHQVLLVGSLAKQTRLLEQRGFDFIVLSTIGFSEGRRCLALWTMIKALRRARRILQNNKPEAVIGFGGHGSFAVVAAAIMLGIPSMIHEQNVRPGRANRWLSKFVTKIAVSFDGSVQYFDPRKIAVTGCPTHLRACARDPSLIYAQWHLSPAKRTILVFGGSQGAHRINEVFLEALTDIKGKDDLQVVHLTGEQDLLMARHHYDRLGVASSVHAFLDHMEEAYQISDLVISRAGALTITELGLFGKPAVLIPYPFAGGHQYENAKEFEKSGLGETVPEKELTPQRLAQTIERRLSGVLPDRSAHQGRAVAGDASKRIADLAVGLK